MSTLKELKSQFAEGTTARVVLDISLLVSNMDHSGRIPNFSKIKSTLESLPSAGGVSKVVLSKVAGDFAGGGLIINQAEHGLSFVAGDAYNVSVTNSTGVDLPLVSLQTNQSNGAIVLSILAGADCNVKIWKI